MSATTTPTFLAVPYAEREAAKALGARWDRATKAWFVPTGVDTDPFRKWEATAQPAQDPRSEFADVLRQAGFVVPNGPEGPSARKRTLAYCTQCCG
jgi:putative DNA primase/helicase